MTPLVALIMFALVLAIPAAWVSGYYSGGLAELKRLAREERSHYDESGRRVR